MSTLPDFTGPGFFAGEAPDGLTTIAGTPTSAQVRVYWRDPADPDAPDVLVASTQSAADGTWQIAGLNPVLRYVVRAQKSQFDDVTVVGAAPSRSDVIAYVDQLVPREDEFGDVDGLTGHVLLDSGLPPFTCAVIEPLPYGLSARVEGRKLLIEGASTDEGLWESVVRVTASNGVWVDVPVQVQIQVLDPHWDKVVSLLHFDADFYDMAGGDTWIKSGLAQITGDSAFGAGAVYMPGLLDYVTCPRSVLVSRYDLFTFECWVNLPSNNNDKHSIIFSQTNQGANKGQGLYINNNNKLYFARGTSVGSLVQITGTTTFTRGVYHHVALSFDGAVLRIFLDGNLEASVMNADGWYAEGSFRIGAYINPSFTTYGIYGYVDEFRATKGVARYTENFTPPTRPFPSR